MFRIAPYWNGFGDLWAVTSHCCLLARRTGQTVELSKWSTKANWDREAELRAILGSFDERYVRDVVVTAERFAAAPRFGVREHLDPYVPTQRRWAACASRIVSYQIETKTTHSGGRFCDPALVEELRARLPGYSFVELGKKRQRTLDEIVRILSESEFFVGIDSGMSHVAHSVGVPVFLKHHDELALCHPSKEYVAFHDERDLVARISELAAPPRAPGRRWLRAAQRVRSFLDPKPRGSRA